MGYCCSSMKARFGENERGDAHEDSLWYCAYNRLTPEREGISLLDFKTGDEFIKVVMEKMALTHACDLMEPLVECAMKRMKRFKPET